MKKIAMFLIIAGLAACQTDAPKPAPKEPEQPKETPAAAAPAPAQAQKTAAADISTAPSIFFDTNKSNVKAEYQDAVLKAAEILKADPKTTVMIEGNCDERGSSEFNLSLGARRAEAVKRQLESAGIPAKRIKTHSLGESQPRATCHDESCWHENRRADFSAAK